MVIEWVLMLERKMQFSGTREVNRKKNLRLIVNVITKLERNLSLLKNKI